MITGDNSLSELFYLISVQQQLFIQSELKKIELNEIQARVINYIHKYPGCIQKDLARYFGKQEATITNILKQLEKKNYIIRDIPDDNERKKNLFLTDDGKNIVKDIQNIFVHLNELVSKGFSTEEISEIRETLLRITHNF